MFVALILFSLYISFVDIRHHRISNRVLWITFLSLILLSVATHTDVYPLTGLSVLLLTPLILWARIGAGHGLGFFAFLYLDSYRTLDNPTDQVPLFRGIYRLSTSDLWRSNLVRKIALRSDTICQCVGLLQVNLTDKPFRQLSKESRPTYL